MDDSLLGTRAALAALFISIRALGSTYQSLGVGKDYHRLITSLVRYLKNGPESMPERIFGGSGNNSPKNLAGVLSKVSTRLGTPVYLLSLEPKETLTDSTELRFPSACNWILLT